MGRKSNEIDANEVCRMYTEETIGVEALATRFHVGKAKIKQILAENGIAIKKRGAQVKNTDFVVSDWNIKKYAPKDGYHYVATDRSTGFKTNDYENKAGMLTTHISKEYGIEVPTLYDRRMYYMRTGNYWWEQWFDITLEKDAETKKCPYCDWATTDIHNNSGAFEVHLKKSHGITKIDYIAEHPEDKPYFELVSETKNRQMETDPDKYVTCMVCGAKLARIDSKHLKLHGMTKHGYLSKYSNAKTICRSFEKFLSGNASKMNLALDGRNDKFTSKPETELREYVTGLGFECHKNRKILNGKELDLYIPEKRIAIEFNGNKWHTEWFGGKGRAYHLSKLEACQEKNVRLFQIFEDEYATNKRLVLSKISHILGVSGNSKRIRGHKCSVKYIEDTLAKEFLEINHIQGFVESSIYIGAFYNNQLVGVMSFKKETDRIWLLTRFASDVEILCHGVGGKLFKFFVENNDFDMIKTFADRRWTVDEETNLYTKLGFNFDGYTQPTYYYYNPKVDRYKRFHKFGFRKQTLHRRHGLPLSMTETEMARSLGYDRIWDCGLIRYVYRKKS